MLIEVWVPGRYLYNLFPSDGDIWEIFDKIQDKHPRAYLVSVENGERKTISRILSEDEWELD
jgi:hypothetical protein